MEIKDIYSRIKPYIDRIETDTRKIKEGDVFIALKGDNFNGNKFASDAFRKGAVLALVDELHDETNKDKLIIVPDVLLCLQELAKFHRMQSKAFVLGITGTNGKTTTKELLRSVLSQKFNLIATSGNLNNHIGVPLTLLKIRPEHQMAIIEMGANHPGEIGQLARIALPDAGIVTNVGKAHLEGFGSFQGVIKTKKELYDVLEERHKPAFVFADQPELTEMSQGLAKRFYYSFEDQKAYCYGQILPNTEQIEMQWTCSGKTGRLHSPLFGKYNAINILASVCVGIFFGLDAEQISAGVAAFQPENNRSQRIISPKNNRLVLDAYNANPVSMKASIESFLNMDGQPKCLLLGDMFELGQYAAQEHKAIVDLLLVHEHEFEKVFFLGTHFYAQKIRHPKFVFFKERLEAEQNDLLSAWTSHYILIKGSRGMKLEEFLKIL